MQNRSNQEPEYESFTIPGTEIVLPILILRGKRYMEVAQRLVWFNYVSGNNFTIETEIEDMTKDYIRFKAIIKDLSGVVYRTARKSRAIRDVKDIDACETGAIGRALALMGFGAAYASEDLSEGEEPVDAPVQGQGVRNETRTNEGTIKSSGENRSSSLSNTKGKNEENIRKGNEDLPQDELQFGPIDPIIGGLAKETATSGVYTGKTFEEIFRHDSAKKFEWTKARMRETGSKKFPAWCAQYLMFAETMGIRAE